MSQQIDQIIQRTQRYWFEDGFIEIAIGVFFFLVGAGTYLQYNLPSGSILRWVIGLSTMILILGGAFGVKTAIERLKERVTYTRSGYIEYRPEPQPRLHRAIIMGVALAIAVLSLAGVVWLQDISVGMGAIMGVVFAMLGVRFGLVRFYVMAVLSALVGAGAALLHGGDVIGVSVYLSGFGLCIAIAGGLALRRYLIDNPATGEGD